MRGPDSEQQMFPWNEISDVEAEEIALPEALETVAF
jgi:hypothetical protein